MKINIYSILIEYVINFVIEIKYITPINSCKIYNQNERNIWVMKDRIPYCIIPNNLVIATCILNIKYEISNGITNFTI